MTGVKVGQKVSNMIAVDVGGTKVSCGVVRVGAQVEILARQRYESRKHSGLEEILEDFLAGTRPDAIGIGVAGPVHEGVARFTNLPWVVDAAQLGARFGSPVTMLNDLEAHAYGLADADPASITELQEGRPVARGNRALIAAGTGLGEAFLVPVRDGYVVSATEGGHCSFAPQEKDDVELLQFLQSRYPGGHVSWERVVSGVFGFRNLYEFLTERRGARPGEELAQAVAAAAATEATDYGAPICAAAEADDPLAVAVVRWFVRLYGAEAGNLALKTLSTGGIYVGGGIAPRIMRWMREDDAFLRAFRHKGRFEALLSAMPVRTVADPDLALKGAARAARI